MSTNDHMKELMRKVVSTLKNMTGEKQRRVLTLFKSKLADEAVQPEGRRFTMGAPAVGTDARPTKGGPKS